SILIRALGNVTLGTNAVLTSVAKLDDGGATYTNPVSGLQRPVAYGGTIAVLSGLDSSAQANIPTVASLTSSNQLVQLDGTSTTQTATVNAVDGSGNSFSVSGTGLIQFVNGGSSGNTLTNTSYSTNGGIIYVDPPNINGAVLNAFAPQPS